MTKINPHKKVFLVIGLGKSGIGAAKLLCSEGKQVVVFERLDEKKFGGISQKLRDKGIVIEYERGLDIESLQPLIPLISSVVISPGIPWNHQTLEELRDLGIRIESEVSLAWKRLKHIPWVGITGTNGKTTVTYMLKHILEKNNINSLIGGNVGIPASELALTYKQETAKKPKLLVMELSSFQLETAPEIAPYIGIWTTFTPDHLERHKTLEKYFHIKKGLLDQSSICIYNQDDKYLFSKRSTLKEGIWVSTKGQGSRKNPATFWIDSNGKVYEKDNEILDSSALTIPGEHNLQNLLLATAAARQIGVTAKGIENGLRSFSGVSHRLERVGVIQGIQIFNDSKATNYDASAIGLKAMKSPSILIAGGQSKQGDAADWLKELNKKSIAVALFGESKGELYQLIKKSNFNGSLRCYENLKEATIASLELAVTYRAKSILFSPACASFDQYKSFEERGNHFKEILRPLINS